MASAAATAFFTVAASSAEPVRIFAASTAQRGISATLVSPIEQLATLPPFKDRITAAAVSGRRHRNTNASHDFARFKPGDIGAPIELARRNAALTGLACHVITGAETHHYRWHIVAWIAIRHIAAERADVAHLRIGA